MFCFALLCLHSTGSGARTRLAGRGSQLTAQEVVDVSQKLGVLTPGTKYKGARGSTQARTGCREARRSGGCTTGSCTRMHVAGLSPGRMFIVR